MHTEAGIRNLVGVPVGRRVNIVAQLYAGLLALGSGIALLATIVFDASLAQALAVAFLAVGVGIILLVLEAPLEVRRRAASTAVTGLVAGIVATACYDISKTILSVADPSPFNPFEAIRVFGTLLAGKDAPMPMIWAVGMTYHILNGVSFAIAYAQFFRTVAARSPRWAIGTGMLWGVFLEMFQLTLFPGWLSIGFVSEFQTISFASHLVYGATIGLIVHRRLRRDATDGA
jgi:hypothetical protein